MRLDFAGHGIHRHCSNSHLALKKSREIREASGRRTAHSTQALRASNASTMADALPSVHDVYRVNKKERKEKIVIC